MPRTVDIGFLVVSSIFLSVLVNTFGTPFLPYAHSYYFYPIIFFLKFIQSESEINRHAEEKSVYGNHFPY